LRDPCFWTSVITTQMVQTITVQHFKRSALRSRKSVRVKSLTTLFCCMTLLIPIVTHRMQDQLNVMQWKVLKYQAYGLESLLCDFPIFGSLQISLIDHILIFDGHVQETAGQWFRQHTKEFFAVRTCQLCTSKTMNACGDFSHFCSTFTSEHPQRGFSCTCLMHEGNM